MVIMCIESYNCWEKISELIQRGQFSDIPSNEILAVEVICFFALKSLTTIFHFPFCISQVEFYLNYENVLISTTDFCNYDYYPLLIGRYSGKQDSSGDMEESKAEQIAEYQKRMSYLPVL